MKSPLSFNLHTETSTAILGKIRSNLELINESLSDKGKSTENHQFEISKKTIAVLLTLIHPDEGKRLQNTQEFNDLLDKIKTASPQALNQYCDDLTNEWGSFIEGIESGEIICYADLLKESLTTAEKAVGGGLAEVLFSLELNQYDRATEMLDETLADITVLREYAHIMKQEFLPAMKDTHPNPEERTKLANILLGAVCVRIAGNQISDGHKTELERLRDGAIFQNLSNEADVFLAKLITGQEMSVKKD